MQQNNSGLYVTIAIVALILIAGIAVFSQSISKSTSSSSSSSSIDAMMHTSNSSTDAMMHDDKSAGTSDAMMMHESTSAGDAMSKKGSFVDYNSNKNLLANADKGNVILFFSASWCPTCKALNADLNSKLDAIPSNLTILKLDYDSETALKQKYGVTQQHTLIKVDSQGNLIKKTTGLPTLESINTFAS